MFNKKGRTVFDESVIAKTFDYKWFFSASQINRVKSIFIRGFPRLCITKKKQKKKKKLFTESIYI
jgi:hypothetical protein